MQGARLFGLPCIVPVLSDAAKMARRANKPVWKAPDSKASSSVNVGSPPKHRNDTSILGGSPVWTGFELLQREKAARSNRSNCLLGNDIRTKPARSSRLGA
jgi:hypothetical protein